MDSEVIVYWIAQGLNLIGALFFMFSVIQKTKKNLITFQIGNTVASVTSFVLLQSYPAAVTCFMALIRNILVRTHNDKKILMYAIATVTLSISLTFNTKGLFGILPALGGVEYTLGLAYAKTLKQIKIAALINTAIWCVHDWALGIYPYAICDTISVFLLAIEIYKATKHPENDEKVSEE